MLEKRVISEIRWSGKDSNSAKFMETLEQLDDVSLINIWDKTVSKTEDHKRSKL